MAKSTTDYDADLEKRLRKPKEDSNEEEAPKEIPPHCADRDFSIVIRHQTFSHKRGDVIEDQIMLFHYLEKKCPISPIEGKEICPQCKHVFATSKV